MIKIKRRKKPRGATPNYQKELFYNGKFNTIVADCPWDYKNYRSSANGAASSAMKTMTGVELCELNIGEHYAAKDCLLVMWATFPRVLECFRVACAWGFLEPDWYKPGFNSKQFISGFPWVKTTPSTGNISTGVGHWSMATSEMVYLFRRGKPKKKSGRPVKGLLYGSKPGYFYSPKGSKHSNKPEQLQDWIERIIDGPYLELFATRPRDNWQTWGINTGFELTKHGVHAININQHSCLPDDYLPF